MGFRARQILALTLVATAVALATALISAVILVRVQIVDAHERAEVLARTLFHLIRHAPPDSSHGSGWPAAATDPFVRRYAEGVIGYSPATLFVAVLDENGVAILHSDPNQEGRRIAPLETFAEFSKRGVVAQIWTLVRENRVLAVELPLSADRVTEIGSVEVAVSTLLLRNQLIGAVTNHALVAAGAALVALLGSVLVANRLLAPIERLRSELSRIDPGEGKPRLDLRTEADVGRLIEHFATLSDRVVRAAENGSDPAWARTMLDGLVNAVIVASQERRILTANDDACRLLGRARAETEGRSIREVLPAGHPVRAIVEEALERGQSVAPRAASFPGEGRAAPYLLSANLLRDRDGVRGVLVTARDVQKLSTLASQLSTSRQVAALGRLTAGVAHEIRNPLNALVIQLELLRKKLENAPEETRRSVDILEEEVRRLDRVIDGFLKFTRPEELRLEAVRLQDVAEDALAFMTARAEKATIRVEAHVARDLPAVHGSADLLRQAFLNLMGNAVDAMPDGGVLRLRVELSRQGSITVVVEDTGVGIAPEELTRVFDLFHTTKSDGSGIGLSLVYRIVQLHGGEISVDSELGTGTRFTMTFPEDAS